MSDRATRSLDDLVPQVRPQFEELLAVAAELGMEPKIRSAGRTCAQQNEQYRLGFSQVPYCRSWHVLGRALDLNLRPELCATYTRLGEIWEDMGGAWGGRWTGFGPCGDAGHFQWGEPTPDTVAVPTELCPVDTLRECEQYRDALYEGAERAHRRATVLKGVGVGLASAALLTGAWLLLRRV